MIWIHVPAVAWAVLIEFSGWICPLTPLENALRRAEGRTPYGGDFVAHYLLPLLYPEGLTRADQLALGAVALTINIVVYGIVFARRRRSIDHRNHRGHREIH